MTLAIAKALCKIWRERIGLSIIMMVLLSGCSGLPDYAMPRGGVLKITDPSILDSAVTYRRLTRSDFKAAALNEDRIMHADVIGANTCVYIRPTKDSNFAVHRSRLGGKWTYYGSIHSIRFEAVMLPSCSWWNPALPPRSHAYVLQHEQIHFAIAEVAARRLTKRVRLKAKSYLSIHPTSAAVQEDIVATIKGWIREANDASLAIHTDFDEDTSMFSDPRAQQWWFEKLKEQLAESQLQPESHGADIDQ